MEATKKRFSMPHTYVILFFVIIIMTLCTYIIPAGEYDRYYDEEVKRNLVDAESFHNVEQSPVDFMTFLMSVPNGMIEAADIVFFIFIVGGSFNIILETGAIEAGIGRVALSTRGKEALMIPVVLFIFSLGGATFGMSEETIVFIPIGIALARAVGYDAMVGMSIVALGAAVGFNSGFLNPFTVGVAQGIAELEMFSGYILRIFVWVVFLVITSIYIMRYARRVKSDPAKSIVADLEIKEKDTKIDLDNLKPITLKDALVLLTVAVGLGFIVFGVFVWEWYIVEISGAFMLMGIISGFFGGFGPSRMAQAFVEGARGIVFGALVVGLARGILVVMTEGVIIDSIVHGLASVVSQLPKTIAAVGMMLVQVVINFFIPSGSGQAAATMPIMTPLSDVIGLTRQTAVLAFQFGDGFTNSIIPTSATLMANLSLAKVSYEKWLKFIVPLMGIWIGAGAVFMVIATVINYA